MFINTENVELINKHKTTRFNSSILLNSSYTVNNMAELFDSLFGSFVSYADEISSLIWYPYRIPAKGSSGAMQTSKGHKDNIKGRYIDYDKNYYYIAEIDLRYYGNVFYDYPPYSKAKLFLPLLGFIDIDLIPYFGKFMSIRMSIDFVTGEGMYYIGYNENSISNTSSVVPFQNLEDDYSITFLNNFAFKCGVEIPLGRSNIGDIKRDIAIGALKTAASFAVGAIAATNLPASVVQTASKTTTYDVHGKSLNKGSRGKQIKWGTETTESTSTRTYNRPEQKEKPWSDIFDFSINALNALSGGGSSDRTDNSSLVSMLDTRTTHLFIFRAKFTQQLDTNFSKLFGRSLGKIRHLSTLKGYTEVSAIHIEGEGFGNITETERQMIEQSLKTGVII